MGRINIVMSTYNGQKYIREQLDSILNSSYGDWCLFIYDDCSTDDTITILEDYVNRYGDRIFLYKNSENRGSTRSFLNGLMLAYKSSGDGSYFMFCDQDDVWNRDKLKHSLKAMKLLERKYGAGLPMLVFTDATLVDKSLKPIGKSFYASNHLKVNQNDLPHILMENKCIGCTTMMNYSLVRLLEDIPENIRYHDWWMAMLASSFGHIAYLNRETLKYRQHGSNQVGGLGFTDYVMDRLRSINSQKEALNKTILQARAFYDVYGNALNETDRRMVKIFISLYDYGWFRRRYYLIRYGFLKSGLIRNIGLFCEI